jgi:hypothetical protein
MHHNFNILTTTTHTFHTSRVTTITQVCKIDNGRILQKKKTIDLATYNTCNENRIRNNGS